MFSKRLLRREYRIEPYLSMMDIWFEVKVYKVYGGFWGESSKMDYELYNPKMNRSNIFKTREDAHEAIKRDKELRESQRQSRIAFFKKLENNPEEVVPY